MPNVWGLYSLSMTHKVSFVIAVYILVRDSALPIMHYYITVRHIIGILRTMGIPVFYLLSTHPLWPASATFVVQALSVLRSLVPGNFHDLTSVLYSMRRLDSLFFTCYCYCTSKAQDPSLKSLDRLSVSSGRIPRPVQALSGTTAHTTKILGALLINFLCIEK